VPGSHEVPSHVKSEPVAGAVAETARPWSCVAFPEDGDEIKKNGMASLQGMGRWVA
jgi:hypothetical protein